MRYPLALSKTVLVTGCSSGIGRATARTLRDSGWTVFPTARRPEDLAALETEGFAPVELDLRDTESAARAVATVLERTDGVLGGLVNNAGFAVLGAVEDLDREALRDQFEVNVFGLHDLTGRLLPVFRRQGWGRIVHVGSMLGRITLPFMGAYCASKYALESLTDALRFETRGSGLAVSLLQPGPIQSRFRDTAVGGVRQAQAEGLADSGFGASYDRELAQWEANRDDPQPFMRPPEAVARRIRHALESPRPRRRYRVTVPAHGGELVRRLFPDAWYDFLVAQSRGLQWSRGDSAP